MKVRVAHAPRARRYRSRARPSGTTSALCNGARGPRACPAVDSAARRARCTRPRPSCSGPGGRARHRQRRRRSPSPCVLSPLDAVPFDMTGAFDLVVCRWTSARSRPIAFCMMVLGSDQLSGGDVETCELWREYRSICFVRGFFVAARGGAGRGGALHPAR